MLQLAEGCCPYVGVSVIQMCNKGELGKREKWRESMIKNILTPEF